MYAQCLAAAPAERTLGLHSGKEVDRMRKVLLAVAVFAGIARKDRLTASYVYY